MHRTRKRSRRRLEVDDVTVVEPRTLKTAIAGAAVGNLMEWYDIGVYAYVAVIIGRMFLADGSDSARSLFSLGVFAVTFIARPVGGIVLGQLGDRLGRQRVLAFTLTMMASATFLIGVLPDYSKIGFWAPLLLIVLKLMQGFSTGGEYAGASTFVTEYAPDRHRALYASVLDAGSNLGAAIGALFVSLLQLNLSEQFMNGWGWRIPFMAALPFGAVAMYFRLKVEDTPAFQAAQEAQRNADEEAIQAVGAPKGVIALIRAYWRQLLTGIVLVAAANTTFYAVTTYMPTYLTTTLHYDPVRGNLLIVPVLVILSACVPLSGMMSDRLGRKRVLQIAALSAIVGSVPAFLLLMHGSTWSTFFGLLILAAPVALYLANLAASLPALFPTESRYGGMGITYNISVALFAGTAPFIMQSLVTLTGQPLAPAFWIMLTSVAGLCAAGYMRESARRPMPGAMPTVATREEARQLVATQDTNPDLDLDELSDLLAAGDRQQLQGAS
ncbi:MFS transporter [Acidipropionibacterium virtanenii]|uniref:MFS transporter n=1 Tax=Acidipropionibacterium virtanenii TaxID=2057246 RepID=UPI001FEBE3CB|nr:MFS transporter [Acidipropionibacterium virtanenii]